MSPQSQENLPAKEGLPAQHSVRNGKELETLAETEYPFCLPQEVSLRNACKAAEEYLASRKVADAALDAWYLLEFLTGISRASYLADRDRKMKEEQRDAYAALVNQRGARIPLQYLTGEQEFMGLPFQVNAHVLIPRQDTETLVELALRKMERISDGGASKQNTRTVSPLCLLDLCTGSGCIAISLAKLWEHRGAGTGPEGNFLKKSIAEQGQKSALEVWASDFSEEALSVARENARRLAADVCFVRSDLLEQISDQGMVFDLIVSNPPYIRTEVIEELSEEVRLHEPRMALDGGEDGLVFYRRIISGSRNCLRQGGTLLLEIGYDQGTVVSDLMRQNGFSDVQVAKDLSGNDRVVEGIWYLPEDDGSWRE